MGEEKEILTGCVCGGGEMESERGINLYFVYIYFLNT